MEVHQSHVLKRGAKSSRTVINEKRKMAENTWCCSDKGIVLTGDLLFGLPLKLVVAVVHGLW
jgi:hypothetical protein